MSDQRYFVTYLRCACFISVPLREASRDLPNDGADAEPPRLVKEMNGNGEITIEPFAKILVAWYIRIAFIGPVDKKRLANNLVPCNEAPIAAVVAVVAIIPHHQVTVGGYLHRAIVAADLYFIRSPRVG